MCARDFFLSCCSCLIPTSCRTTVEHLLLSHVQTVNCLFARSFASCWTHPLRFQWFVRLFCAQLSCDPSHRAMYQLLNVCLVLGAVCIVCLNMRASLVLANCLRTLNLIGFYVNFDIFRLHSTLILFRLPLRGVVSVLVACLLIICGRIKSTFLLCGVVVGPRINMVITCKIIQKWH